MGRTQSYVSPFTALTTPVAAPAAGSFNAQHSVYAYPLNVPTGAVLDRFWIAALANLNGNAAAYGNSLWVAVGAGGLIATSSDGTTWTKRTSGTTSDFTAVAYGNSVWVAVTNAGTIYTSSDGTSWSAASSPGFSSAVIFDVAYGMSSDGTTPIFVAVGQGGRIRYATDPTGTWSAASAPGFGTSIVYGVFYGGGNWVAVGASPYVRYTTDPTGTWSAPTSVGFSAAANAVHYGNSTWVAVGNNGAIRTTSDPSGTWAAASSPGFSTSTLYGVAYDGSSNWVAMTNSGANNVRYATTPSGTWTAAATLPSAQNFRSVAYGNGRWLLQANSGGWFNTATSPTGTWSPTGTLAQVGLYRADGSTLVLGAQTELAPSSTSTNPRLVYDASATGTSIPAGSYYLALWSGDVGAVGFMRVSSTAARLRARYVQTGQTSGLPSTLTLAQEATGLVYLFGFTTK